MCHAVLRSTSAFTLAGHTLTLSLVDAGFLIADYVTWVPPEICWLLCLGLHLQWLEGARLVRTLRSGALASEPHWRHAEQLTRRIKQPNTQNCSSETIKPAPKSLDQSDRLPQTKVPQAVSSQGANLNAADTPSSSRKHAGGPTSPVLVKIRPVEEVALAASEGPREEVLHLPKKSVPVKPSPTPRLVLVLTDGNECVVGVPRFEEQGLTYLTGTRS